MNIPYAHTTKYTKLFQPKRFVPILQILSVYFLPRKNGHIIFRFYENLIGIISKINYCLNNIKIHYKNNKKKLVTTVSTVYTFLSANVMFYECTIKY